LKEPVTIKDLAHVLGISPSTVSRALKDHPDISPETKKQVQELAEEMNYQPNLIAQGLRQSRTHTIGVIVPEFIHFFFSTVIAGIENIAHQKGYNVIMCQSNEDMDREAENVKALRNSRVDGLLVSLAKATTNFNHFRQVVDNGLPIVFFDRTTDTLGCSRVVVDDYQGSFNGVELLIKKGCKRIVHLAGPVTLAISGERMRGYLDCLKHYNIPVDDELIIPCTDEGYEESKFKMGQLVDQKIRFDGVFANHDMAAYGAMIALQEHQVPIPEQVKIVGFSDWQFSHLIRPQLTSVSQPGMEMGEQAANLLIDEIESSTNSNEVLELKTRLIERETT